MKEYKVCYGNDSFRGYIGVYAKNESEAKEIAEKCLTNGLKVIKVTEL